MVDFIPYGKQYIDNDDINAVVKVLESRFLTQGPIVTEFEEKICRYTGAKYCVAVSNGTAALHLAVKALEIEGQKEGITSPITFVASSNCLLYNNLKPCFADIDETTYCVKPSKIIEKITENTKIIIPVHFAGHPCDMEKVKEIAIDYNLYVIEDAAHAIGSKYSDGTKVGNCKFSDMTIFSFHPVKNITTGEGGAITTNSFNFYQKLKKLVTHGITKDKDEFQNVDGELIGPWYYEMQTLGFNYRITDIQCALGISQLNKLDGFIHQRRNIVKKYNEAFSISDELIVPQEQDNCFSAYHLYVLQFKTLNRLTVFNELLNENIGVNVHYIPVHLQPYYQENFGFKKGDFQIAEKYYSRVLTLPLFPKMSKNEIDKDIQSIYQILKK
ncbi:MAG: UDP-4-amino-4,6-dideoxy-N-acetyl-beta-L-altrosamine transaminase [Desulfobacula sp.]|nr:UDP-4-amino-4,6-dideoxy-N-acetyl-beta-L-altrosamine transaminase [Desulfobacula sp.]